MALLEVQDLQITELLVPDIMESIFVQQIWIVKEYVQLLVFREQTVQQPMEQFHQEIVLYVQAIQGLTKQETLAFLS